MKTDRIRGLLSLVMLCMLVCVGVLGYRLSCDVRQQAILLREESLRKLTYTAELNSYQAEIYGLTLQTIYTDDLQKQDAYKAELQTYTEKVDAILKNYTTRISADQPELRHAFEDFVNWRMRYREIAEQIWTLLSNGQSDAARKLADTTLIHAYRQYAKAGDVLFNYDVAGGNQHSREIERAVIRAQLLMAFICVAIFFGGLMTALVLFRKYVLEGTV